MARQYLEVDGLRISDDIPVDQKRSGWLLDAYLLVLPVGEVGTRFEMGASGDLRE